MDYMNVFSLPFYYWTIYGTYECVLSSMLLDLWIYLIPELCCGTCKNGGTCDVDTDARDYHCQCPPGYEGRNCTHVLGKKFMFLPPPREKNIFVVIL